MPASPSTSAWREPMVWLVAGGPVAVIIASFFTLALAIRHPDPPLEPHPTAQRAADDAGGSAEAADLRANAGDVVPAMVGRNHAATGVTGAKR